MNLAPLLSTSERLKILEAILYRIDRASVNSLARQLNLSKGLISQYFELLVREGMGKKIKGKFVINHESPMVKGLKILHNLKYINTIMFKKYPYVLAVGVYGSCAKGENTEESDVDLWVRIGEATDSQLAALTSALRKKINEVNVLFLSKERVARIKKEDALFYQALSFGSIVVYGEPNGLEL
jgi:predicted nucleotidyltransferase